MHLLLLGLSFILTRRGWGREIPQNPSFALRKKGNWFCFWRSVCAVFLPYWNSLFYSLRERRLNRTVRESRYCFPFGPVRPCRSHIRLDELRNLGGSSRGRRRYLISWDGSRHTHKNRPHSIWMPVVQEKLPSFRTAYESTEVGYTCRSWRGLSDSHKYVSISLAVGNVSEKQRNQSDRSPTGSSPFDARSTNYSLALPFESCESQLKRRTLRTWHGTDRNRHVSLKLSLTLWRGHVKNGVFYLPSFRIWRLDLLWNFGVSLSPSRGEDKTGSGFDVVLSAVGLEKRPNGGRTLLSWGRRLCCRKHARACSLPGATVLQPSARR